ncbi:hypothetical protein TNCV_3610141 [Trichonephila clavipes]|nr:hypothetical protein TNCV_3610141 [Trichonephila clavipes]
MEDLFPLQFCATVHNPEIIASVNWTRKDGTKEEVPCPKAVTVYNDVMGWLSLPILSPAMPETVPSRNAKFLRRSTSFFPSVINKAEKAWSIGGAPIALGNQ